MLPQRPVLVTQLPRWFLDRVHHSIVRFRSTVCAAAIGRRPISFVSPGLQGWDHAGEQILFRALARHRPWQRAKARKRISFSSQVPALKARANEKTTKLPPTANREGHLFRPNRWTFHAS